MNDKSIIESLIRDYGYIDNTLAIKQFLLTKCWIEVKKTVNYRKICDAFEDWADEDGNVTQEYTEEKYVMGAFEKDWWNIPSDVMPKDGEKVLCTVLLRGGQISHEVGHYNKNIKWILGNQFGFDMGEVLAWMYIPSTAIPLHVLKQNIKTK